MRRLALLSLPALLTACPSNDSFQTPTFDATVGEPPPDEFFDGGVLDTGSVDVPHPTLPPTINAASPPPPISGGTMLATADGKSLIVADPDRDTVTLVALPALKPTWSARLNPGDQPGRIAVDGAGRIHVVLRGSGGVASLDPLSGAIIARRKVCTAPRGIAVYHAISDTVYIACAEGVLASFDPAGSGQPVKVTVEPDLRDVVILPSGIWVSKFRSAEIMRVDGTGAVQFRISQNLAGESDVAWRLIPVATGSVAMVHQQASTSMVVTQQPGGYGSGGTNPCASSIVQTAITMMSADVPTFPFSMTVPDTVLPVDIAYSRPNEVFAIAAAGNAYGNLGGVVVVTPPASGGGGDCASRGQVQRLFGETTVVSVAFDAAGTLYAQTREPSQVIAFPADETGWPGTESGRITLSSISRADTGHTIFHTAAGAQIACASCHPEGSEDGRVWHFDIQGARKTPSLLGTVEGTAPYHWDGSLADMGALIDEVYLGRMSGQMLAQDQRQALQSWVFALPAPVAPAPVDAAAVTRGAALFHGMAGCAACHSGPRFTNNMTMDVGTGAAFQVPSLIGVGWRTPLLHDGCAATLQDRFGTCSTPMHGNTATLTPSDVDDLIAYLDTL
jgi:hypothetical protein